VEQSGVIAPLFHVYKRFTIAKSKAQYIYCKI